MLSATNKGFNENTPGVESRWFRTFPDIVVLNLIIFFLLLPLPIHASTQSEFSSSQVSATVPDSQSPSTPILISPTNNSTINSSSPAFIFETSTDNVAVHKYELWLNEIKNTEILHSSTTTISITATSALTDGQHTWKIKAVDTSGNTTDSATWTFIVDTTAPIILINQIAEHQVTLSSQDNSTIPANYSLTTTNQLPTFTGSSEANANIVIILTSASTQYTFTTTANSNASFTLTPNFQLGTGNYTVSISATDLASNSSSLPSFSLIIKPTIAVTTITIPLPTPLKDLSFNLPFTPTLIIPKLPAGLTAFPLTTESPNLITYLPWLIILSLLSHIYCKIKQYHKIYLYITLIVPIFILIYLSLATLHWLPIFFLLMLTFVIYYTHKHAKEKTT
ncbi:hypothetical protein KKB06_00940 [Patescibacteria group bacterium]|nr:hypothetical protein [Patescibacteria group bacterium]